MYNESHPFVEEAPMRAVALAPVVDSFGTHDTVWTAELPLPAAFLPSVCTRT